MTARERRKRTPLDPAGGRTALYRHYDADDRLLYVGISGTPENRTRWHKRHAEWIDQAVRFTGVWYRTRLAALAAEWKAINEERPLFNRHGISHERSMPPRRTPAEGSAIFTFRIDTAAVDDIDGLADAEDETRSAMIRVLLNEALEARNAEPRF